MGKNKNLLYKKYPQLGNFNQNHQCQKALSDLLINLDSDPYNLLNSMSAKYFFDMANPQACDNFSKESDLKTKYSFLRFNATWVPE